MSRFSTSAVPFAHDSLLSRFARFALVVLLLLSGFGSGELEAWVFHPDRAAQPLPALAASDTLIVLDPDQWSRSEILGFRQQGWLPIARLNIAYRESDRTFAELIDKKWLVVPKHRPAPEPAPIRFYLAAWQKLLLSRVDQVAHCGFSGICIEGTSAAEAISDHPTIEREMQNWSESVVQHFKRLGMGQGLAILRCESAVPPSVAKAEIFDGIIVSGVWTSPTGRRRRPWEQTQALSILAKWLSQKKRVMTLDHSRTPTHRNQILEETRKLGFDADLVAPKGEHR